MILIKDMFYVMIYVKIICTLLKSSYGISSSHKYFVKCLSPIFFQTYP